MPLLNLYSCHPPTCPRRAVFSIFRLVAIIIVFMSCIVRASSCVDGNERVELNGVPCQEEATCLLLSLATEQPTIFKELSVDVQHSRPNAAHHKDDQSPG